MTTIIRNNDLFIFGLLSPEESAALIATLSAYEAECRNEHDPEFINRIENAKVRAAFSYFNRRFERRKKKKPETPVTIEPAGKEKDDTSALPEDMRLAPFYPFTSRDSLDPAFVEREREAARRRGEDVTGWPSAADVIFFSDYWRKFHAESA